MCQHRWAKTSFDVIKEKKHIESAPAVWLENKEICFKHPKSMKHGAIIQGWLWQTVHKGGTRVYIAFSPATLTDHIKGWKSLFCWQGGGVWSTIHRGRRASGRLITSALLPTGQRVIKLCSSTDNWKYFRQPRHCARRWLAITVEAYSRGADICRYTDRDD